MKMCETYRNESSLYTSEFREETLFIVQFRQDLRVVLQLQVQLACCQVCPRHIQAAERVRGRGEGGGCESVRASE